MNWNTMIEEVRKRQKESEKYANPRKRPAYYVVVKYDKRNQEWTVTRYADDGIEMERERYHLKGNAKYIANLWMDTKDVTRIYIHKVNGKMDDIIMKGMK